MSKKTTSQLMIDKQPIAVFLTDTHLDLKNQDLVSNIFKQVDDYCEEHNITNIFHGGDFFNSREAQPLDVLSQAKDIIDKISSKRNFYIIPGNHDKVSLTSPKSYLDFVTNQKTTYLFNKYNYVDFSTINIFNGINCDISIHLVPYFKENANYIDFLKLAINNINKDHINILITHIAVNGVKNNDGSCIENQITSDLFKKFDKVLVGHYHNQSKIGNNIFYTGSAYQANFGEDIKKGMTVIFSDGSIEFVELDFPKYISYEISQDDVASIKQIQKQAKENKNFIRAVISGDENEIKSFDKKQLESLGVKIKFKKNIATVDLSNNDELVSFDRNNITDAFDEFCKEKLIVDTIQGKKYLKNIL